MQFPEVADAEGVFSLRQRAVLRSLSVVDRPPSIITSSHNTYPPCKDPNMSSRSKKTNQEKLVRLLQQQPSRWSPPPGKGPSHNETLTLEGRSLTHERAFLPSPTIHPNARGIEQAHQNRVDKPSKPKYPLGPKTQRGEREVVRSAYTRSI